MRVERGSNTVAEGADAARARALVRRDRRHEIQQAAQVALGREIGDLLALEHVLHARILNVDRGRFRHNGDVFGDAAMPAIAWARSSNASTSTPPPGSGSRTATTAVMRPARAAR